MKLSLGCSLKQECKLHLTLLKKCPHCGAINDIGRWTAENFQAALNSNFIAGCWRCGKPLYKYKGAYINLLKSRIEQTAEPGKEE